MELLICSLVLSACDSKDENASKEIIENFLTSYQSLEEDAAQYLTIYGESDKIQYNGIQSILAEQMIFDIGNTVRSADGYLVNVKITNVDFQVVFEKIVQDFKQDDTQDDILKKLEEEMQAETVEKREFQIDIPVQKINGKYEIELTPELSNALFGGYNEYITKLTRRDMHEETN